MNENFDLLVGRVLYCLDKSNLEKISDSLKRIKDATICCGVGGSLVVTDFMTKILNEKNDIVTKRCESRDMLYINKRPYKNVVCCSYGGMNFGVNVAFNNDFEKYLFSAKPRDGVNNITYNSCDIEKSFIALAATLMPMAILLSYYLDGNHKVITDILNDTKIPSVSSNKVFEVMSGCDTSSASTFIDSTFTESGIAIPIIHDKYDFCHGRSTTSYKNSNSLIFFNGDTKLDKIMLEEVYKYYDEVIRLDYKYEDPIVNDFYLTYKSMLLSKRLAEEVGCDLSNVNYSPIARKLYKFRGDM